MTSRFFPKCLNTLTGQSCKGKKEEEAKKKLLMSAKEIVAKEMASMATCQQASMGEDKKVEEEEKNPVKMSMVDTMVKEGEGGSVTTLLLSETNEKNKNKVEK